MGRTFAIMTELDDLRAENARLRGELETARAKTAKPVAGHQPTRSVDPDRLIVPQSPSGVCAGEGAHVELQRGRGRREEREAVLRLLLEITARAPQEPIEVVTWLLNAARAIRGREQWRSTATETSEPRRCER